MIEIIALVILGAGVYWFFILRPERLDFWKVAARHPDAAYEHFRSDPCWKIFEEKLPEDYRSIVPKSEWVGPFWLVVPKLGNKTLHVFGKYPILEQSQNNFLSKFVRGI